MNVVLWIAQSAAAAAFLMAGVAKLVQGKEGMAEQMTWVENFSPASIRAIGIAEVAGALGLLLPAVTSIAPILVPIAAVGLGLDMLLAAALHVRRSEWQMIPVNTILLALVAFVAWGRFGDWAF